MKQQMLAALAKLDPRLLLGLMILVAGLTAFEGWSLLLRAPLAEYQKLISTRESLALSLAATPSQQGELARLAAELRQVSARLTGQLRPPAPDDQIASLVMAELDRSAGQNGITLAGIRPGPRREVLGFEEASFEVSAQGNYLRLCQWLMDFERTLGQSATVSEFTMKAAGDGRVLALTLNVGLYRPLQLSGVAK
jgi:Tfp pilus assembly protein PilO